MTGRVVVLTGALLLAAALVVCGLWLIHPPTALIVAGVLVAALALAGLTGPAPSTGGDAG